MEEIAREMIDEIASCERSAAEKLKMYFWIQNYLWGKVEEALDND